MRTWAERSTRPGQLIGRLAARRVAGFFQLWTTGQISSSLALGSAGARQNVMSSKALRPGTPSGLLAVISNVTSGSLGPPESPETSRGDYS